VFLAKIICKAIDYGFLIQDDKVVIFNIPLTRKALPEGLHVLDKKQKDGLGFVFDHRDDIYHAVQFYL